jgi:hypothetical protein
VLAGTTAKGAAWASVRMLDWAQTTTVMAGTTAVGAALACNRLFEVGSDSHCVGGDDC